MKFRSRLVVNLNSLKHNFEEVQKIAPNNKIIFMVKADGYGHGMYEITRYACTNLGIKEFGCATLKEAIDLRENLRELEFDIYVFSDTQLTEPGNDELYLNLRIIPVISKFQELDFVLQHQDFKNFPICIKFNTGMNRLGFMMTELDLVINKLKQHHKNQIHHLLTHYANGSYSMTKDHYNIKQRENFELVKKKFLENGITFEKSSEANSGSIEQKNGIASNSHIRPGLMMYGPSSLNEDVKSEGHFNGKTISSLETYILKTYHVTKGTVVGYNSTPCPDEGVVAVLAIGYGDGFGNRYSGATLIHNGCMGKIIGRVSMDMCHVFFPISAKDKIKENQIFTIWGDQGVDLVKFSEETRTIPYEIFCSLQSRIPRIYQVN